MKQQPPNKQPEEKPDNLFATPQRDVGRFSFNEAVARVFPDMISRSVPGYSTIVPFIGLLTERFAQPGTHCYDLGCSLGAATLAMRQALEGKQCRLIGIDNAEAMIERCHHYIELDNHTTPVDLKCDDIRNVEIERASVVTLNFTLQFLPREDRLKLLTRIRQGLNPGGALILSEKVHFNETAEQQRLESLHLDFKRANGYSEMEISQKRAALEEVLVSDSIGEHHERLQLAGFSEITTWFQCFNFVSILAVN